MFAVGYAPEIAFLTVVRDAAAAFADFANGDPEFPREFSFVDIDRVAARLSNRRDAKVALR